MSVISQISPQARIEELILYLVDLGSGEDTQTLELFAKGGFDEVLMRQPFDSLRRVEIVAGGDSDKPERSKWLLWAARTTLPRFAERGTIRVVIHHSKHALALKPMPTVDHRWFISVGWLDRRRAGRLLALCTSAVY